MSLSPIASGRGLRLERVVGLSEPGAGCIDVNPKDDTEIAYPVGCVVVLCSSTSGKQRRYMRTGKPVASLKFSPNGNYLAVGERGHNPAIVVWELATNSRVALLKCHKIGVSRLTFSPDESMLLSVGVEHDDQLLLWDWRAEKLLARKKLDTKLYDMEFSTNGETFVTVGVCHLCYWSIHRKTLQSGAVKDNDLHVDEEDDDGGEDESERQNQGEFATKSPKRRLQVSSPMASTRALLYALDRHQVALLPDYKNATFTAVTCGRNEELRGYAYVATLCGSLLKVDTNRLIDSWVFTETSSVWDLSLYENSIACSCTSGLIRVFAADSLEFETTLPLPRRLDRPLCEQNEDNTLVGPESQPEPGTYADVFSVHWSNQGKQLIATYADRSIFVWDRSSLKGQAGAIRAYSYLCHPTGITGIARLPRASSSTPDGILVTCSDDTHLRFWRASGTSSSRRKSSVIGISKPWSNPLSNELVRDIEIGPSQGEVRCLDISADGGLVATGDKEGRVFLIDIDTGKVCFKLPPHTGEVLSLSFSPSLLSSKTLESSSAISLLASGGRDRVVHLYDTQTGQKIKALRDHSGIVTAVRFSLDGQTLLSAGGDRTIVLSKVQVEDGNIAVTRLHSVATTHGTINSIDIEASNKYFCTAGQDKKISIWSMASGKPIRSYKPEGDAGELGAVTLDPAGMFCAVGSQDKAVRLFDFYSGECVARSAGHSEPITGVVFSKDCKRLISTAWDGCMFVWRLAPEITSAMKERLHEIQTSTISSQSSRPVQEMKPLDGGEDERKADENTKEYMNVGSALFASGNLPSWAKEMSSGPGIEDSELMLEDLEASFEPSHSVEAQGGDEEYDSTGEREHNAKKSKELKGRNLDLSHPQAMPSELRASHVEVSSDDAMVSRSQEALVDTTSMETVSSDLSAPRSPLPEFQEIKSLSEERKILKMKEGKRDADLAVRRMRDQLKGLGLLAATIEKKQLKFSETQDGVKPSRAPPSEEPGSIAPGSDTASNEQQGTTAPSDVLQDLSQIPENGLIMSPVLSASTTSSEASHHPPSQENLGVPVENNWAEGPVEDITNETGVSGLEEITQTCQKVEEPSLRLTSEQDPCNVSKHSDDGLHTKQTGNPAISKSSASPAALDLPHGVTLNTPSAAHGAYTPGTPLRTAEEARSACDFALAQVQQAMNLTMSVFQDVNKLDTKLGESLNKSQLGGDDFATGLLETSREHVRGVMNGFKNNLKNLVEKDWDEVKGQSVSSRSNEGISLERSMFMQSTPDAASTQAMMSQLQSISTMLEKALAKQ
eukprot:CAMPEP_0184530134 /NCGR_PEP_ID=MMETSP0198_2-20121128/12778_1 /TAXON_ID=1112570 /ORGANISM="Thraustochytrium sp., Strain LLF1b" /LENGTH=1293 /DNA_ID=CAMNT_0026922257 /DNA_START=508 /DNA_END=4389 /DNA_ORIENTATION=-